MVAMVASYRKTGAAGTRHGGGAAICHPFPRNRRARNAAVDQSRPFEPAIYRLDDDAAGTFADAVEKLDHANRLRAKAIPDHAGDGVRGRRLLGLQPGAYLRDRERLRRARRVQGLRQAAHASGFLNFVPGI
jgi:hypothetical protein